VQSVSGFDITEKKRKDEIIRRLAEQDPLTALMDRRKFLIDLGETLEKAATGGPGGFVLFMDLDDFKIINDSLGHLEGDELLCRIGAFLTENSGLLGTPYRYGGDEFVILAEGRNREDIRDIAAILLKRFRRKWRLTNSQVNCRISIGAAPFPQGKKKADEIIHSADLAMYKVKENGKDGFSLAPWE
jgi:diguanylate cyclase (GGDEF)-like protein